HAVRDGLCLCVDAGERREERGVNVEDAVRIRGDEGGAEQPHVAGQGDEVRLRLAEDAQDVFLVRDAVRVRAVVENVRGQAELASGGEAGRVRAVADEGHDLRGELTPRDGLVDGHEVRAAARQQDGELHSIPYSIHEAKPAGGTS